MAEHHSTHGPALCANPERQRAPRVGTRQALCGGAWLLVGMLLAGCPPRLNDTEKYTRDGNAYMKSGSYAKAETAFDLALQHDPTAAGALVNRGNARMLQEKFAAARTDYDAALALQPNLALAYANRGMLFDRLEDTPSAIADYRRALELDPGLGQGPGIWERILRNPPTETIRDRLDYLHAQQDTQ